MPPLANKFAKRSARCVALLSRIQTQLSTIMHVMLRWPSPVRANGVFLRTADAKLTIRISLNGGPLIRDERDISTKIPGLARACKNSAVGAEVDGEGGGMIQQVYFALRALLYYKLLPTDATRLPHEYL